MDFRKNLHFILLIFIFLVGFVLRLYRIDNPIADWHSWRQADTSSVSRELLKSDFDFLHPRYHDLSNVPSGMDNPEGYRMVEFPIYNAVQAGLFTLLGGFTIEQWGRIVSIFSSVFVAMFLYLIVSRHSNKNLGFLAAAFYLLIPYNIYYNRTILPDTMMAMAILGGIFFFNLWIESDNKKQQTKSSRSFYFLLSIIFTSSSFLLKPYALLFTLPMIVLVYQKWGFKAIRKWQLWIFTGVSLLPLFFWRQWILQFPTGIPENFWLYNGNGIRFRPAFFRWIGYERVIKLIGGYLGSILLLYGILKLKDLKEWIFFFSFLVSSGLYVMIFATGNVQHDYYQILIMPTLSIFFAIGAYFLYRWNLTGKAILFVAVVGMFYFGWDQVKDYFNINNRSIIIAGEAVDRLTPQDALVIAEYGGDTSLLYQTKRRGWASQQNSIPEMVEKGASYMVIVNPPDEAVSFAKQYKIIESTPQYVIFDIRK